MTWLWFQCGVFLPKQYTAFNWKDPFSTVCVSPGSAETLFRWGGKI